ncbi:MAG TPA: efflux RND transporter periplasmic adaptor subunit [Verrucomicrobiae bacterium]|jgi:membrane fusion protein (multidrug efflux system)|nr:efflux RND transporter periplasmic adaptor subunit [Verrucomicrobiae bacterium]
MRKQLAVWAAAATLFAVSCKQKPPPPAAPQKVQVLTVSPRDVPIYQSWIGSLDGYPNAQIRAQVTGYLLKQDYLEGSKVKQGDLLFEIDPRPFKAALDGAVAKLDQDKAALGKTELDVKRYTPLAKEQAISQQELDDAVQANLGAKAAIEADNAAVETAKLNLGFTRITSPVDGIAGVAQAQIGDLVGLGSGTLTTVSTVDPIRAYFNISEQFYMTYSRQFGDPKALAEHEAVMPLQLMFSDGSMYRLLGKWYFTGRQVDLNTGTLQVAALFDNPDSVLRPGQYAQIRAQTEMRTNALAVPQRAVTELQGAYQVATVDDKNVVHIQTVKVGNQVGTDWLIDSGLKPGDRVVAEGTQKARNGEKVDPQPYVESKTEAQ